MCRWSSTRDRGSALIEAVVIGSFVFVVVLTAVSAAIDVAVVGGDVRETSWVNAVHTARHSGALSGADLAWPGAEADRDGNSISVTVAPTILVPHPDGLRRLVLATSVEIPLAPFRSDRG